MTHVEPFTDKEMETLRKAGEDGCVGWGDSRWLNYLRFLATVDELKEANRKLFKDVLGLKKNLGEYTELIAIDVIQKKRIKELEARLAPKEWEDHNAQP